MSLPTIIPGRYRHYKGRDYEVLGLARHSETEEWLVVYRPLYETHSDLATRENSDPRVEQTKGEIPTAANGWWVRPLDMFLENVEVSGIVQPRFQRCDES